MKQQQVEALQSAYQYIPRFKEGVGKLASTLKVRTTSNEREEITHLVEGIAWLIDIFRLTKDVQKTVIKTEGIVSLLEEMSGALENDDMILLSDLLEYELIPIVEEWDKQIEESLN